MSDLGEKLASQRPSSDTTNLRARWGELRIVEGTERAPTKLELRSMAGLERWRFAFKAEGMTWFEQERAS